MTPELRAALADALARRLDARRSVPDDVDAIAPIIDAAIDDARHEEAEAAYKRGHLDGQHCGRRHATLDLTETADDLRRDALLAAADDLDALRENGETWAGNHASRQSYNAGVLAAQEMLRARANEGNTGE